MLNFKQFYLLSEGGVYGHMSYVYERLDFTFRELKDFFSDLVSGRLDRVTEKVDGQNIFFTWRADDNEVRFARNTTQIKQGGISIKALRDQFSGRGVVQQIFSEGGQQIYTSIMRLDDQKKIDIFGERGDKWINAEIIHTASPNVIIYKGNHIVLHGMYTFTQSGDKIPTDTKQFNSIVTELKVALSNWNIMGPIVHSVTNFDGLKEPYDLFCNSINSIISKANLDEYNTIGDFVERKVRSELIEHNIPENIAAVAAQIVVDKSTVNILELKKQVDPSLRSLLSKYITQTGIIQTRSRITEPLQKAVTTLSIEVLKDMTSILVLDSKKEAKRIRDQVSELIKKIYSFQDVYTTSRRELVAKELAKHSADIDSLLNKFESPIEGIVIEYPPGSGNLLKLTGAFGTINQILGLGHYGRGNIPPIK